MLIIAQTERGNARVAKLDAFYRGWAKGGPDWSHGKVRDQFVVQFLLNYH